MERERERVWNRSERGTRGFLFDVTRYQIRCADKCDFSVETVPIAGSFLYASRIDRCNSVHQVVTCDMTDFAIRTARKVLCAEIYLCPSICETIVLKLGISVRFVLRFHLRIEPLLLKRPAFQRELTGSSSTLFCALRKFTYAILCITMQGRL